MDERPKCKADTIKLLEENLGRTLHDINHRKILFDPPSQRNGNKNKNEQMRPNETSFAQQRKP